MKELSVGAITFLEKKVLLIHQINGNHIGFPKGHIEINESPEKTALREVYEETGIKIKIESLAYSIKYKLKRGIKINKNQMILKMKILMTQRIQWMIGHQKKMKKRKRNKKHLKK